jgi:hypothetical protein
MLLKLDTLRNSPNTSVAIMDNKVLITLNNPTYGNATASYILDLAIPEDISTGNTYYNRLTKWLAPAMKACGLSHVVNIRV